MRRSRPPSPASRETPVPYGDSAGANGLSGEIKGLVRATLFKTTLEPTT
jgi:hypothetical protein